VVGWFWFLITLVPVIGLVQVGVQSMADRYTYIPLTGLFIMTAWGIPDLARGLKYREVFLALLAGTIIITSTILTWQQLGYWQNNEALYRHTLHVTTGNYVIHNNLGNALANKWELDDAIAEFKEALRINSNYSDAHYNLGMVFAIKGNHDAAIQELQETLRINPGNTKAHFNLGVALEQKRWQDGSQK
jgi:tetratricopeptide (TPR) repeat protein